MINNHEQQIFPFLRINKIKIGQKMNEGSMQPCFILNCMLRLPKEYSKNQNNFWKDTEEFSDFIKYGFVLALNINPRVFDRPLNQTARSDVLLDEVDPLIVSTLTYKQQRIFYPQNWKDYFEEGNRGTGNIASMQQWHRNFSRDWGPEVLSLTEIKQIVKDKVMNSQIQSGGEIYFEKEIFLEGAINDFLPYFQDIFNYVDNINKEIFLNVYSYSFLDIAEMEEEYNLGLEDSNLRELASYGGNVTEDRIFTLKQTGLFSDPDTQPAFADGGRDYYMELEIPKTRKAFFFQSHPNISYSGPAYYWHPFDQLFERVIDENGEEIVTRYDGWHAGSRENPGFSIPFDGQFYNGKLIKKDVPNPKVYVSNDNTGLLGLLGDNSEFYGFGYFGAADFRAGDNYLPFGDSNLVNSLNQGPGGPMFTNAANASFEKLYNILQEDIDAFTKKRLNQHSVDLVLDKEEWISVSTSGNEPTSNFQNPVLIEPNCHNILFTIDYKKLLAMNSKFGFLLNARLSNDLPQLLMSGCRIKDFRVYRRRLSNLPVGNNKVSSPEYIKKNQDEIDPMIVSTRDACEAGDAFYTPDTTKMQLLSGFGVLNTQNRVTLQASVLERDIRYPGALSSDEFGTTSVRDHNHMRSFQILDYELFNDVQDGNYTYIVEMKIEDGIQKVLQELFLVFKGAQKSYDEFITMASTPLQTSNRFNGARKFSSLLIDGYTKLQEQRDSRNQFSVGSYDYEKNKYAPDSPVKSPDYHEIIRAYISSFLDAAYLFLSITGAPQSFENFASAYIDATGQSATADAEQIISSISPLTNPDAKLDLAIAWQKLGQNIESLFVKLLGSHLADATVGNNFQRPSAERNFSETLNNMIDIKIDLNFVVKAFREGEIMIDMGFEPRRNRVDEGEGNLI